MSLSSKTRKAIQKISITNNTNEKDTIWEVETIIAKKYHRASGQHLYLVKWKGWSIDESTWEPLVNLKGALSIVKRFEKTFREVISPLQKAYAASEFSSKSYGFGMMNNGGSKKVRKKEITKKRTKIRKMKRDNPESNDYKKVDLRIEKEAAKNNEDQIFSEAHRTPEAFVSTCLCEEEDINAEKRSRSSWLEQKIKQEQNILEQIESPKIFIEDLRFEEENDDLDGEDQVNTETQQEDYRHCTSVPHDQFGAMIDEEKFNDEKSRIFSQRENNKSLKADKDKEVSNTPIDPDKADLRAQFNATNPQEQSTETQVNSPSYMEPLNEQTNKADSNNLVLEQSRIEPDRNVLEYHSQTAQVVDPNLEWNQYSSFPESRAVELFIPNQVFIQSNQPVYFTNAFMVSQPSVIVNVSNPFGLMQPVFQPIQPVIGYCAPVLFVNPVNNGFIPVNVVNNPQPFYIITNSGAMNQNNCANLGIQNVSTAESVLQENSHRENNTSGFNRDVVQMNMSPQTNLDSKNLNEVESINNNSQELRWRQDSEILDKLKQSDQKEKNGILSQVQESCIEDLEDTEDIFLSNTYRNSMIKSDKRRKIVERERSSKRRSPSRGKNKVKAKDHRCKKSLKEVIRDNEKDLKDDLKKIRGTSKNIIAYVRKNTKKQQEDLDLLNERKVLVITKQGSLRVPQVKVQEIAAQSSFIANNSVSQSIKYEDMKIEMTQEKEQNVKFEQNHSLSCDLANAPSRSKTAVFRKITHSCNYSEFSDYLKNYDDNSFGNGHPPQENSVNQICPGSNFNDDEVEEIQKFSWRGAASLDPENYLFKVLWKSKSDGTQKPPSIVSWKDLKQGAPKAAIKFTFDSLRKMVSKSGTFGEM